MDKLQEIKNRFSIATSLYKKKIDVNWSTILEDQEFLIQSVEKQREIIEENKRQQEVTVHQFRQAQKDIQRITKESDGFKQALEKIAALKPSTNNDINACNFQFAITTANLALEGAVE
ncbi:VWA domain-containing protein [Bacillus sp. YIM B13590]|uniref:VWA domain-containing protein n=1 Tax=Bacillus sp. YIM B13590 TaxID=3366870 RepID=UPI003B7B9ED5